MIEGDVVETIARAESRYDAILLDVDNGPAALTTFKNKRLYADPGLRSAARALRQGGVLAVWSVSDASRFTARLRAVGFQVETKRVLAGDSTRRRHQLWLATRAPLPSTRTPPLPTRTPPLPTRTSPLPTRTSPLPTRTSPPPARTSPPPARTSPPPARTSPPPARTSPPPARRRRP